MRTLTKQQNPPARRFISSASTRRKRRRRTRDRGALDGSHDWLIKSVAALREDLDRVTRCERAVADALEARDGARDGKRYGRKIGSDAVVERMTELYADYDRDLRRERRHLERAQDRRGRAAREVAHYARQIDGYAGRIDIRAASNWSALRINDDGSWSWTACAMRIERS